MTSLAIIEAVNIHLPPSEQFHLGRWWPWTTFELLRAYRRFYPEEPLLRRQRKLIAVIYTCTLAALALFWFDLYILMFVAVVEGFWFWFVFFRRPDD